MCLALMTRISLFIILNLYLEEHEVGERRGSWKYKYQTEEAWEEEGG